MSTTIAIPKPTVVIETLGAKTSETKEGLRKINNYLLKKEIGHGAFGTVHLGINTITNEEFAIKEFSKSRLRRKEQMAMMKKGRGGSRGRGGRGVSGGGHVISTNPLDLVRSEVAILKKLNHHNVIKLYEVLDDPNDDSLYMVMEMAHKGVLMQIDLNEPASPYTEELARNYFRQIILGIEYLHYNDIVHRDIKPDNLLLSDNNVVKIVDFGVSEIFIKGDDALKSTAGSPAFMPPELCMARHGPVSGKAADIWSMGVTLYCLVHSYVPFSNDNLLGLYGMIENDPVKCKENISSDLLDLLHRLLEKDPESRIIMHELRNHPWVTNNGQDLLVSKKDNCRAVQVTEEDIKCAITSIRHIFTVMQAVAKFKRHSRSLSSNSVKSMMSDNDKTTAAIKKNKVAITADMLSADHDMNSHVINIASQDHHHEELYQPMVAGSDTSPPTSPPDMSSTFSSAFSTN